MPIGVAERDSNIPSLSGVIDRPRLLSKLDHALQHKITLICAPPGYGKTTIAAQYAQYTNHPVVWHRVEDRERDRFLGEARRVARELVVIDSSLEHSPVAEEFQPRVLEDGSRWEVYKRYSTAETLADELGGGETLFEGRWFVVVSSRA